MTRYALHGPQGQSIDYQLIRRPRRTIGLKISAQGLVVHAPQGISDSELHRLLLSKWQWIVNKLAQQSQQHCPAIEWQDGADLLLLGQTIYLDLVADSVNRQAKLEGNVLNLAVRDIHNTQQIARKVLLWYRHTALQDFQRRIQLGAAKLGLATPTVYLSNAKGRWGSCNSRQQIRLNWRLIQAPPALINYVVAHELAHTQQMNHSPRFWAVVEQLYPDYRAAEQALKQWSARLHRLQAD